jgi:anthranilate phosphoribosyltransferase
MSALLATRDEAQIGAFLAAMRMKGEVAEELAGFVDALGAESGGLGGAEATAQPTVPAGGLPVDVDAHADGHRGRPTLLPAAAALAARAGADVLIRFDRSGVRTAHHLAATLDALGPLPGVTLSNLGTEHPALKQLLDVRARIGVRTCINSLVKLWSPRRAPARLLGIFHTPYHVPMARSLALLGLRGLVVQAPGGLPEPPPDRWCRVTFSQAPTDTVVFDAAPLGDPGDAGALPEVAGPLETLELNRDALFGRPGPARKAARLGAAAILVAAGLAPTLEEGFARADAATTLEDRP